MYDLLVSQASRIFRVRMRGAVARRARAAPGPSLPPSLMRMRTQKNAAG